MAVSLSSGTLLWRNNNCDGSNSPPAVLRELRAVYAGIERDAASPRTHIPSRALPPPSPRPISIGVYKRWRH